MHRHLRAGFAAACLFTTAVAHADDADVEVFGPISRSSIALFDAPQSFHGRQVLSGSDTAEGSTHLHDNLVSLSGIWAIDPRWNVTAQVLDDVSSQNTFTFGADRHSVSHTGVGEQVAVSTWLAGDARRAGPGLAATAGVMRRIGMQNRWYVELQPQLRTSDDFAASAVLEVQDAFEHGTGAVESAAVYASWRAMPGLNLVPGLGLERFAAYDTYSSFQDRWTSLSATWHIDTNWSVSVEGQWVWQTNADTTHYINSTHDGRGINADIGVRRYF